jgi:hypothetical protein
MLESSVLFSQLVTILSFSKPVNVVINNDSCQTLRADES